MSHQGPTIFPPRRDFCGPEERDLCAVGKGQMKWRGANLRDNFRFFRRGNWCRGCLSLGASTRFRRQAVECRCREQHRGGQERRQTGFRLLLSSRDSANPSEQ